MGLAALASLPSLGAVEHQREAAVKTRYTITDERYGYEFDRQGAGNALTFNWITRRDPCFLVSGDLPRAALARTFREPSICPSTIKLGDLRIRCKVGGKSFWLDEAKDVRTRFLAWGTEHRISLAPDAPVVIDVTSSMAENRGIAVRVSASTDSGTPVGVELELYYGGLHRKGRPADVAPYFVAEAADSQDNTVTLDGATATLSDPSIPARVTVSASPSGDVSVTPKSDGETGNRVLFRYRLSLSKEPQTIGLLAYQSEPGDESKLDAGKVDQYQSASQDYFRSVLDPYEIHTPDQVLNAGFYTAVVNLDWDYQSPAWLEGIHWWAAYLTNNYQVSAAVCLGQTDRARDALKFAALRPEGPSWMIKSDGTVNTGDTRYKFEEGLLYYIEQLYRYWRATGDRKTLDEVWQPTVDNLEKMLTVRDPEGNGLLNYHMGSNGFLYQADHLSLPGDSSSPSIIATDCLEKMAEMSESRGDTGSAGKWRRRAEYMRSEILRRLWSPEQGKFLACIDTQGLPMQANYYTDFVFPQLYSKFPAEYSWISLKTLDSTLRVSDSLIRVGNLLPGLFGNNNVMPVQISEAAEAYCAAGRSDDGYRLLHGAAFASTVHTESPGNVPERMSDTGMGLPDYVFGNPIGSFLRGVVAGLFGLERAAPGHDLTWHPAIPADWRDASLTVTGVRMSISGAHGKRTYRIDSPVSLPLDFRAPLLGHRALKVTDGAGHDLPYTIEAHPGGGFVRVHVGPSTSHTLSIASKPAGSDRRLRGNVRPGAKVEWKLASEGLSVSDPQRVFQDFRVDGDLLRGRLTSSRGKRTFFLRDAAQNSIRPVEIDLGSAKKAVFHPLVLQGKREHLSLDGLFNSESIESRNFWDFSKRSLDMSDKVKTEDGRPILAVGDYRFVVRPSGKNIALIEIGDLEFYTQQLKLSDKPNAISLNVGKPVLGVELLLVSEWLVRLTGMQVGDLVLHYADGSTAVTPLVHGKNIGSVNDRFQSEVTHLELKWLHNIYAFAVEADPSRKLDSVELRLYATDGSLGILGANVVLPSK